MYPWKNAQEEEEERDLFLYLHNFKPCILYILKTIKNLKIFFKVYLNLELKFRN